MQSVPAVVPPRPCHTLGRGFDLGKPTHLKTLGGPPCEDGTVAGPAHHPQSLHCLQQGRGGAPTWGLRRPQCVGDASEALRGQLRNRSPSVGCAERPLTTNIAGDESLFPRPEPRSLRTHRPRATTSLPHHRAACGSLARFTRETFPEAAGSPGQRLGGGEAGNQPPAPPWGLGAAAPRGWEAWKGRGPRGAARVI